MTLSERIDSELKTALKGGDHIKVSTLRMLKAAVSNAAIQKGTNTLEDGAILEVIQKQLKQRQESIDAFTKGGRLELADKETKEATVLKSFLPPAMNEEELRGIIQQAIQELRLSQNLPVGQAGIGQVMKLVLPKVKGRVDGKQVSQLVQNLLES